MHIKFPHYLIIFLLFIYLSHPCLWLNAFFYLSLSPKKFIDTLFWENSKVLIKDLKYGKGVISAERREKAGSLDWPYWDLKYGSHSLKKEWRLRKQEPELGHSISSPCVFKIRKTNNIFRCRILSHKLRFILCYFWYFVPFPLYVFAF